MSTAHSQPPTLKQPPILPSLALLAGGVALYFLVWKVLDPPSTWTCSRPSSAELAELSERRSDFLAPAMTLAAVYTVVLATVAWRWASARRARQGYMRRPGRFALGATVALGAIWSFLIGHAFTDDAVGGSVFGGAVLASAGVIASAALAIAVLVGAFRSPGRSPSEDVADSLWVGLIYAALLVGTPQFLLAIAVAGKDATVIC